MYFLLANAILLAHLLLVIILVIGTGATLTGKLHRFDLGWRLLYLATWLGVFLSQVLTGGCVLTEAEKALWNSHMTGSAYKGTFFGNYFPAISELVNRYGLWLILVGALSQVLIWVVARTRRARAAV